MISTLALYCNTIRYLKWRQIFFQIYYWLTKYNTRLLITQNDRSIYPIQWNFTPIGVKNKYIGNLTFEFLNQKKIFSEKINFNFIEFGRLWNYNLQYADYLLDESHLVRERESHLFEITRDVINNTIRLEPYPVSLRIINTILFISKHNIESKSINNSLRRQINFLKNNKEYHIDGNHLLENLISLSIASIALQEVGYIHKNSIELEKVLSEQIVEDGGHYERSPMYHNIILYRLLILYHVLLHNNGSQPHIQFLKNTLTRMLAWIKKMQVTHSTFPHFGDSTSNIMDEISEIEKMANENGIFYTDIPFSDSGYRKYDKNNILCYINFGNISPVYQPGHSHSDIMHYVLYKNLSPIIVDTAISTYDDCERRLFERSTHAHNTVSLQDQSQSELWSSFRFAKRANLEILIDESDTLEGLILFADRTMKHKRKMHFEINQCTILDEIIVGAYGISYIHFDHTLTDIVLHENHVEVKDQNISIYIFQYADIQLEEYQQAVAFNSLRKSTRIAIRFTHKLETRITWDK
jgi:hypothetical protein